eukprot:475505-Rhodomonas_salina.2
MMLVEAVQRWAMPAEGTRGNGGLVALHNGTFVPWHRVRGLSVLWCGRLECATLRAGLRRRVSGARAGDVREREQCKWAGVKKSQRAIEKQLRIYAGDPSRLVDICRQSLAFESVADLE